MAKPEGPKYTVGDREKVDFPELKRKGIVARIDSGAQSSTAHCDKIWLERMGGKEVVCCHFLKRSRRVVRFEKFARRKVKSSNGLWEERFVVKLLIRLGPIKKRTDVTLTDRSTMNHSVLLGRKFLKHRFLIDVSKSYILSSDAV